MWPQGVQWSAKPSKVLRNWIEKPKVMMDLGRKLLEELSDTLDVYVGRNYREDMVRQEGQAAGKIIKLD